MERMPILKLEIEGIRTSICHMISDHNDEINNAMLSEITKAIDSINIEEMVKRGVMECTQSAIKQYFEYGQGRSVITQAVFDALDKNIQTNDVSEK